MGPEGISDYYARLEVAPGASRDDIVNAYRRLAMGAHPDANPEDPDAAGRFREIAEAYEVLGDPKRRDAYDRRLVGTRIQVRVDNGRAAGAAGEGRWHHHEDEPVVLSSSWPRRSNDVSLGVSPVHHERIGEQASEAGRPDDWLSEVSDLFWRIVEPWWEV
jgi:hypothetical protein